MNILKPHLRTTIQTLLKRGATQREIARITGVDRKTIRACQRLAKSSGVATGSEAPEGPSSPPWPPAPSAPCTVGTDRDGIEELKPLVAQSANFPQVATGSDTVPCEDLPSGPPACGLPQASRTGFAMSECEPHRSWIEAQVQLGRNAVAIYQDLVEAHGFSAAYNSVKRFVGKLRARAPERFDVLEFLAGEEAQVDYGQGAPTLAAAGKHRRPYLFVMTLKFSGKSFRKAVWKTSQEIWARLHEEAFRAFGGSPRYVVLDNLKEGVIRPDIYAPELNPVYAAMLAHYGAVADPCRVRDPNRKGTVENAIQHTQGTALKGRQFDSIEAQNTWLAHWEERWAALRIHGRKKRQVLEMFREEQPHLGALPMQGFRYFTQGTRMVDDAGLVQVHSAYYAALPAAPHSEVTVRIFDHDIEILDAGGQILRRHEKALHKGSFKMEPKDRIFNPSRETIRLLAKAERIGPSTTQFARELFDRLGRPGQRAIYGLVNLARTHTCADIEEVCARLLKAQILSYASVKRALDRKAQIRAAVDISRPQTEADVRTLIEYQTFWDNHSQTHPQEENDDGNVY